PPRLVCLHLSWHVAAGLAHGADHLVQADLVLAVAAQGHAACVDGLHRAHRVALDAGDLHQSADRVAGQAEVVLLPISAASPTRPGVPPREGRFNRKPPGEAPRLAASTPRDRKGKLIAPQDADIRLSAGFRCCKTCVLQTDTQCAPHLSISELKQAFRMDLTWGG